MHRSKNDFKINQDFLLNFPSPHTRKAYQGDLKQFFDWIMLNTAHKSVTLITRQDIIEFRNQLMQQGGISGGVSAPKTIARKLASISSYFDFLTELGDLPKNPAHSVKRPRRVVVKPTNAISKEQMLQIFEKALESKTSGPMHHALLITFFTTGLRKSEIINLKIKNYREINEHKYLEFTGKGGKIGQKILHPICIQAIEQYILFLKEKFTEITAEEPLFRPCTNPSQNNYLLKNLNPKTINEIFNKYARAIGLNFNISPHSARASFISELLNIGVDIYSIAKEVHHSSVKTTEEYDKRRRQYQDPVVYKLKF